MRDYLPFLIVGITSGSVYALAGMGLVLTFKTSGIFNFAHGVQAALAAYAMYEFRDRLGWPWPIAVLGAVLVAGVVGGLILERIADRLSTATASARVVATVGLLVGVQGLLVVRYGSATIPFRPFLPTSTVRIGDVNVTYEQLLVSAFVLLSAIGLYVFFSRARLGIAMQAVVDDSVLLGLRGTDPLRVRRAAWIIGSMFASLSGVLLASTLGLDVNLLTLLVFYAFGAAAVGSFSSLPATYLGGLGVGIVAALTTKLVSGFESPPAPLAALPSNVPFIILFVVLLVTPPERLRTGGSRITRKPTVPTPPPVRAQRLAAAIALPVCLALPHIVDTRIALYTLAVAFVAIFGSLGLLVRTSAQVSLCHMAFAAIGASTFAHAVDAGVPWGIAVLVGGLVAIPIGAMVAIPAIRLSGVYLAVATFGFGLLFQRLAYPTFLLFGKDQQLSAPRPSLPGLDLNGDIAYFYVVLAIAAACTAGILAVRSSRLGRVLRAMADSPTAVDSHGTSTSLVRLYVFCVSAFFAGIAGAVIGPVTGTASAGSFDFSVSLLLIAVLFVTGSRPVLSPVLAAVLYIAVPGHLESGQLRWMPVVFGLAAIFVATVDVRPWIDRWRSSQRVLEREPRTRCAPERPSSLAEART